jgi:hypothetical protein
LFEFFGAKQEKKETDDRVYFPNRGKFRDEKECGLVTTHVGKTAQKNV